MKKKVTIVTTGVANIASVIASFTRLGCDVSCSSKQKEISNSDYLVLPGVGTFSAGMNSLKQLELEDILKKRVKSQKPTFAICLGLQLFFKSSEESKNIDGLGIIDSSVKRFPKNVRIPHFGWNKVSANSDSKIFCDGYAYFANSFYVENICDSWAPCYTKYGQTFVSAFEKGCVAAAQFHPELSGEWGKKCIDNWLKS